MLRGSETIGAGESAEESRMMMQKINVLCLDIPESFA